MPADGRAGAGAGAARLETNRADDARFATVCCACPRRVLCLYVCVSFFSAGYLRRYLRVPVLYSRAYVYEGTVLCLLIISY